MLHNRHEFDVSITHIVQILGKDVCQLIIGQKRTVFMSTPAAEMHFINIHRIRFRCFSRFAFFLLPGFVSPFKA